MHRTYPAGSSEPSPSLSFSNGEADDSDEEEGGQGAVMMRGTDRLSPVATCREHSQSAWLHFPHVELVFLFFAFEGAVASQASVLRQAKCPEVFFTAVGALVSYVSCSMSVYHISLCHSLCHTALTPLVQHLP